MGLNWSDILYPGNPDRRDEVNRLAQSIRTSVAQIFSNVRTLSRSLHRACNKFQEVDRLNLDITYEANFKKLQSVLAQWKQTTEEILEDPTIPQQIKDLMSEFEKVTSVGQFPDTVNDILSHPSLADNVSEPVVGAIVGTMTAYFSKKWLSSIISSSLKAVSAAGLLGTIVGTVASVVVGIIIGAIEGAEERRDLEHLKREYEAMDKNLRENVNFLEDSVADVVTAIIYATRQTS